MGMKSTCGKGDSPEDSKTPGIRWYLPSNGLMKIFDLEFLDIFFSFLAL
jgi:hypothetical protein